MVTAATALARYRDEVVREMRDVIRNSDQALYGMQRYFLGWQDASGAAIDHAGGKLFRPALCLLSCTAVGGEYERALPAAAAIEFLHNFSLIHDDIEDGSRTRHGRPTVWELWGLAHGINAGDSMFTVARLAMHRLMANGYAAQSVLNAMLIFDRACQRLCEGQDLDLRFEERVSVTMAEYLQMIDGKTGALIGACASLGALLGDAVAATVVRFDRIGRLIGRAFQIQDDVLGVWGAEERTGKPTGDDIRTRKKAFPIVKALELAGETDRRRLLELYAGRNLDEAEVLSVVEIFDRIEVREFAEHEAREAADQAVALIEAGATQPAAREELVSLARFVAARDA